MKLAFISFYSGLAQRGGETFVDSLAGKLAKDNEVYVFQVGKSDDKPYKVEQIKIHVDLDHPHSRLSVTHPLKRLFIDYFHIKELIFTIKLIPKLRKLKPDVIFPQNSGWEVILLKVFTKAKILIAGQSGPGWNDKVNLFIHPGMFVALTNAQADWAKKIAGKDQKISVIPNGVDLNVFSQEGKIFPAGLPKPIVLVVGAAIKSKRIPDTIKAVSELGNTSLLVVGTGPDEEEEDTLGKKLLGDRFRRLKVSHKDMPAVYRASNVFTLCSDKSEAFGIVYLEALACGLTCVVTDDRSRREILGKAGIFVKNPDDQKEYAEKLSEALTRKNRKQNLDQAKKYSWDEIAGSYEKIIKDFSKQAD